MTFLRHSGRHVHQSVVNHLTTHLTALGWLTEDAVPFGADPFEIVTVRPFVGNTPNDNVIKDGVISITLGSEFATEEQELGGPLTEQDFPIFCDIFAADEAIAVALATDVRDVFYGRFDGSRRVIPIIDQVSGTPAAGWTASFEDIERISQEHTFPLSWQTVQVNAVCNFAEVQW